jgi:hypothetical protein
MKIKFGLGDLTHYLIMIITLGQGEKIAQWWAHKVLKIEDCGCTSRRIKLNNWGRNIFRTEEEKTYEF